MRPFPPARRFSPLAPVSPLLVASLLGSLVAGCAREGRRPRGGGGTGGAPPPAPPSVGAVRDERPIRLVAFGDRWLYQDGGADLGEAWRQREFAPAARWSEGGARFGFGNGDEQTTVSFGPDPARKFTTTYFRRTFTVTDPRAFSRLALRVLRDDGVVVYLNGREVMRDNMPAGPVGFDTYASEILGEPAAEGTAAEVMLDPGTLVAGENLIAVEVHQAWGGSSDLLFDLELRAGKEIVRGPYLQSGTPESAVIHWRTATPTASRVAYAAQPAGAEVVVHDPTPKTEHIVRLTGLAPATTYEYTVGDEARTLAGGDGDHVFVTYPAPGTQASTRIWVLGDSGTANHDARRVRDAYARVAGDRRTDVWLMLGDNAYETGTDAEHQAAVFDMYPRFLQQVFLWPTIGNHETAQLRKAGAGTPYLDIFDLPTQGEAGGVPSGTELYYSFDHGDVHFVCLDSMVSDRAPGGAMLAWLEQDLAANLRPFTIAFWHHPPYSRGGHDSDVEVPLVEMRSNVLPILERHGVDLVLAGHSHAYERSFLLDGHYDASRTFGPAFVKNGGGGHPDTGGPYRKRAGGRAGAVYAVAGASGKVSAGAPLDHPAMFVSFARLGSLVIDVTGPRLEARYLRETGVVDDSFVIVKE